jgi:mannitol/fructose-specific phosphotransferase system IIA component
MSEATLKRVRIEVTQAFAGLLLAMKDLHSKGLVDEDYLMALLAKD